MSEFFSITNEALHKLLACVLFRGFEKAELPELLEKLRAKEINRKKGEFFFYEGEPAERVGILLSGEAQVVRDDYDGSRSVLSDLKEGDIFGEVLARMSKTYRSAWRQLRIPALSFSIAAVL